MSADEFQKKEGYFIQGLWYPRVTSICQIKNKPALYYFYARAENYEEADLKKNQAAAEGTMIHHILEKIIIGDGFVVPEQYLGIKKAFDDFIKNHAFHSRKEWLERRVKHSNHRYSGTFDILAEVDGELAIVDLKSSASIYRDYRLQTAAYLSAINEEPWLLDENGNKYLIPNEVTKRYVLRINQKRICEKCGATMKLRSMGNKIEANKNSNGCQHQWGEILGEWELKEFDQPEVDFQAFINAKGLWEWENQEILGRIGYL